MSLDYEQERIRRQEARDERRTRCLAVAKNELFKGLLVFPFVVGGVHMGLQRVWQRYARLGWRAKWMYGAGAVAGFSAMNAEFKMNACRLKPFEAYQNWHYKDDGKAAAQQGQAQ